MHPDFVVIGKLTRDYILYHDTRPLLDVAGGAPLHALGGLAVWGAVTGLVSRISPDYPKEWLVDFKTHGIDIRGVRTTGEVFDQRDFMAYSENFELITTNPVAQFARRNIPYPRSLLGYQTQADTRSALASSLPGTPAISDIPPAYLSASAFHLCAMDLSAQMQFANTLRGAVTCLTLDPSTDSMHPNMHKELRGLLNGLSAFLPSIEQASAFFWGQTRDPWEMAAGLAEFGCKCVLMKRGPNGQLLYDAVSKRRWEIPAYPARISDYTGAGDAFCGGFLFGYQKNDDPLEGALYGNISASIAIESPGPFSPLEAMPGLAQARLDSLRSIARQI